MVQYQEILSVFFYLSQKYQLSEGIYVQLKDVIPTFQYMWPVEGSNLTFKFSTIEQFQHAYEIIQSSNAITECISYRSNFITFKYYPVLKRAFVCTECFSDISYLHEVLNQQGVKEIIYKFKNFNN